MKRKCEGGGGAVMAAEGRDGFSGFYSRQVGWWNP
jgi:hypothetical protein